MKLVGIEQVQKRVGKLPAPKDLKVIDHIDSQAARWLSYSSFAFIAFGRSDALRLTAAGGSNGFVSLSNPKNLQLPVSALEDQELAQDGDAFGALFLVSGMEESLRVNGTLSRTEDESITLNVEECYLHCAKAFRRSDFWSAPSNEASPEDQSSLVTQSRFLVLASMNSSGQIDVSPKGDPANLLIQEDGERFFFGERPGNRRIDSFRNILEHPQVSILSLVPGCQTVIELNGEAELRDDDALLQRFIVEGKKPKLVTQITPDSVQIKPIKAIAEADLWPAKNAPDDLVPSDIFKAHIQLSRESSLQAKLARAAVSLPGAMEKGLEFDYKNNLY